MCCDNYTQIRVSPHTSACVIIHNLVYDVISVCCSVLQCAAMCCSVLTHNLVYDVISVYCYCTPLRACCLLCVLQLHASVCLLFDTLCTPPPKQKENSEKRSPFLCGVCEVEGSRCSICYLSKKNQKHVWRKAWRLDAMIS